MENEKNSNDDVYFEEIIKKTKTGITFPKNLREDLFDESKDTFFRMIVPNAKDKIILEILSEEKAKEISKTLQTKKPKKSTTVRREEVNKEAAFSPTWGEYFVYDFPAQDNIKPILESAFYKFAENPPNLEDGMGRVKYALVSFLSSTKTENAKLYFAVEKFLLDVIEKFNQPNLIDWIFDKIIPSIKSKFLYEQALLELVEASLKNKRWEKAEIYIFHVLKNIDDYSKSEMYNIMNSFKQLVKKVRYVERSDKIDILLKEKLMEYGEGVEDTDYKIQIVEFLEDLSYIELGYELAKKIQLNLSPESMRLEEVRRLVRRLHIAPVSENKPQSSIDFDEREFDEE